MKLSDYARQQGIHYRTALRWFHAGKIHGRQVDTGTILIDKEDDLEAKSVKVAVYVRVSSSENKANHLLVFCPDVWTAQGKAQDGKDHSRTTGRKCNWLSST